MTPKDKKIIEDAERLGIPIFVLTAKDVCSVETLEYYHLDAYNKDCDEEFLLAVQRRIYDFQNWQIANKESVKLPD